MWLLVACCFHLLITCTVTSSVTDNYSIIAKNETLLVQIGQNAVLNWVLVNYQSLNQTIQCTAKSKNTVIALGVYNTITRRFSISITQDSQSTYDFRLDAVVHFLPGNRNLFTLTIRNSIATDSDKYVCTYGQQSSEISLQVYSELREMGQLVPTLFLKNNRKTVSLALCATPKPEVSMELLGVVTRVKGLPKPNSNCYEYVLRNITLNYQKQCGKELKLTYKGVEKTLRRSVKLLIPLRARAPSNVQIRLKNDGGCPVVRWDGPNIGSCVTDTLRYDIAIYDRDKPIRNMRTSSNIIEACGIDFLHKDINVKVMTTLGNTNSTWTKGSLILDEKPYDGMQTAIIACAALAAFLLILLSAYCFYKYKYAIMKSCIREKSLSVKTASEEEDDEITPLNKTLISLISPQKQSTDLQKNESKRKSSRRISLDIILGDGHTLRKHSTSATDQNKVHPPQKLNHSMRFHSLQRNIERERKKLEEQELEQQLDDMYTKRRNTDSKVFQEFKNTLNHHHIGQRMSGEADIPGAPGSPLYDVLPSTRSSASNTRSSASTSSTGPSYHEEDERPLPINRRRTTINEHLPDINGTSPLYDVLPRTNSNVVQQPYNVCKDQNDVPKDGNQVYDYIPSGRTDKNGIPPVQDSIYDVPVKPTVQTTLNGDTTPTGIKYAPFSSHRKQKQDVY